MSAPVKLLPYTSVFIKLLKGPIDYTEKNSWEKLLQYKAELSAFLQQLGLALVLVEQDGYAYLQHSPAAEEDGSVSWVVKRALSYDESVLLVLLREMMQEFETGESASRELIKKRREIKDHAEMFFKENASRVKFLREIDRLIDRAEENGFLEKVEDHDLADEQRFRIKKIIKARVDNEELAAFYQQLQEVKQQQLSLTDNLE